jgi:DNA polymerase III subunit delta'
MMGEGAALLGHDEPWREWRGALASARMHHAWILAGKQGLGKSAFALAAARELVAEAGVPQPELHPDVILLAPLPANDEEQKKKDEGRPYQTKRNISVDQVRGVQQRLNTRPTLGARRAIVIDPADDMEKGAVNALLKSLEEPPTGTFFLLVAHRPGRLLPTIRSRCRTLRFAALTDAEVARVVSDGAPQADAATRAAAVAAAEGSPGAALAFVEQDLGAVHALMVKLVGEGDPRFALRGALAGEIGTKPERARQLATLDLARAVLAGRLRDAVPLQRLRIIDAHAALATLTAQVPTYNYEAGLLAMEIGGLLASAAMPRETA